MIGVEGIGTPGFTPAEPADSFPGITFTGAGKWNLDGIQCSRCHNATAPRVVDTQIADSAFPSTHVTSGGMGAFVGGVGRTNICFGCHQSIANTNNGTGPDKDLSHPENIPVKNAATAPDYLPEFSGHVLGNSFLNSPHARFTGKIVPNPLGKYDLEDPTTRNENGNASKYNSKFQGYTCWQSATSNSPAKTMIVDGEIHEIKTQADCESLYGAGAWRSDKQGTCTTCHDVHNSLFVKEQKELALRKVCTDCHDKSLKSMGHPDGPGTPLGDLVGTKEAWEACVTCHMPKATSSGFPMHLWRINTNADYRTFPTATEFGIGATATKKIANAAADGDYTNAVWVDVDYVCGQCHGGSLGTDTQNGAPYFTKKELSTAAKNVHNNPLPNALCTWTIDGRTVTLTDTSTDEWYLPDNAVTVNWGDGASSTGNAGAVFSHAYAKAKRYRIVHTVTDSRGATKKHKFTVRVR
jgi:predicted CXXCH cytochrome family protein